MELNLGLSTLLYIAVFLFPGLIFRRFVFVDKHVVQFNNGNLFERFLSTLWYSILAITLTTFVFVFAQKLLKIELLDSISYDTIKSIFDELSNNKLPEKGEVEKTYLDFGILLVSIYTSSAIFGFLTRFISNKFGSLFGFFKYKNYWDTIFKAKNEKIPRSSIFGFAMADVLIETNEGVKRYSGRVKDYHINSSYELQTIILSNAWRYKTVKIDEKTVKIKKKIPGHYFVIDHTKILNINVGYVFGEKSSKLYIKFIELFGNTMLVISFIGILIYTFTDLDAYTTAWYSKIVFLFFGSFTLMSLVAIIKKVFKWSFSNQLFSDWYFLITSFIPLIWVFNFIPGYFVFLLELFLLLIFLFILNQFNINLDDEKTSNIKKSEETTEGK